MVHIVKTEEQEQAEDAQYRAYEDSLLKSAGLTREDFVCFEGVFPVDEAVVVVCLDEADWDVPPKSLLSTEFNRTTRHWEYTFFPVDGYDGPPTVETY